MTTFDPAADLQAFEAALDARDEIRVLACSKQFADRLVATDQVYPAQDAHRILAALRAKRQCNALRVVAEALLSRGQTALPVRRLYGQGLIELGQLALAIVVLDQLAAQAPAGSKDNAEARGSLGRAYKQLYVNAARPDLDRNRRFLVQALAAYGSVYREDPQANIWHGINTATLLVRAARDQVPLAEYPDPVATAREIALAMLVAVRARRDEREATMYDCATAAEACWVLDQHAEADVWLQEYLRYPAADLFEVASTRRQFVEVWRVDAAHEPGATVLHRLGEKFLRSDVGGELLVSATEARSSISGKLEQAGGSYEKVFGADSFQSLDWLDKAKLRALGVARIGRETARGIGTGFLVRGGDLCAELGDERLLLTNAHVISNLPGVQPALDADEAVITFEALGGNDTWGVKELLWSSPPAELDATLLRLDRPAPEVPYYPIDNQPPIADGARRVYIIGHPAGGSLSFSMQDNVLLDYQLPRLHYRTPTEGGSSGSPVFSATWRLIGMHHKGDKNMPQLNGKPGFYAANEGIWLGAIRAAIASYLGSC
jgi:hypothetical protein